MSKRKKSKPAWHGRRAMLNLPGHQSTAAVVAEISDTSHWEPGLNGEGYEIDSWNCVSYVNFQISDCDRRIRLDFSPGNIDNYPNDLHKINTLIDALSEFRDGLIVEQARYLERMNELEATGKLDDPTLSAPDSDQELAPDSDQELPVRSCWPS